MTIKYYVHPISHDLLVYDFETKEVIVIEGVQNVRVMLAGQVTEDEDYMERGRARNFNKKRGADYMSQEERIRELLIENPDIESKDISDQTGIPVRTIYALRSKIKKEDLEE